MNGTAHAGLAVLALVFVAAVVVIRYAVTPAPVSGRHRAVRVRPVEEYVPARDLIPAFAGGWPRTAFAHCVECRGTVTVVIHGQAHRCDRGHVTTHPIGGA